MDTAPSEEKSGLSSSATHRRTQKSTTLNRKYVKKPSSATQVSPAASQQSAAIDSVAKRRAEDLKRRQALADKINRERMAALHSGKSIVEKTTPAPAPVQLADPLAEKAAAKAEAKAAASTQTAPITSAETKTTTVNTPATKVSKPLSTKIEKSLLSPRKREKAAKKLKQSTLESAITSASDVSEPTERFSAATAFSPKRLLLAFSCAALAVGVVAYFISVNTPDLSVRVAAMQSGIEASYPSYIPRGFSLSDIVSENGKISMTFSASDGSFTLTEEKSTWDNAALESNYAKQNWGQNYTIVREQGISLYISGSDAAWLNGGILYKIDVSGTQLTKKQIKTIATSL